MYSQIREMSRAAIFHKGITINALHVTTGLGHFAICNDHAGEFDVHLYHFVEEKPSYLEEKVFVGDLFECLNFCEGWTGEHSESKANEKAIL